MASFLTPTLVIPDEKSPNDSSDYRSSQTASTNNPASSNRTNTKKLTRILSTESCFDRQQPPPRIAKRFSIDADPLAIVLNTPITDLSNNPSQQPSSPDVQDKASRFPSRSMFGKERQASLKKSDSFLEIPYEKAEIVDLIRLADGPNAATHLANDGNEVLLEHGHAPQ